MTDSHPIPKALRDRFDQIEDAICRNRMERDAVFTQMRTAVQAHFMSAEPEEGDHEGRQLEWERAENKRLRDELATAITNHRKHAAKLISDRMVLKESLTAAEQRNADLEKLIAEAHTWVDHNNFGGTDAYDLRDRLAAAIKPTEPANKESAQ